MSRSVPSSCCALCLSMLYVACGDPAFGELDAAVSEQVSTVITVRFDTPLDDVDHAAVEFSADGGATRVARAELADDGSYEAVLVGNKPDTEVLYRPVVAAQGQTWLGPEQVITTGALPGRIPEIRTTVDRRPADGRDGYLVTTLLNSPSAVLILDGDGDVVWWHEVGDEDLTTNRAWLARDGQSVLYRVDDQYGPPVGLVRVGLDGIEREFIADDMAHHDFVELADGTIAVLRHDTREIDGVDVIGDQLVELTPDGGEVPLWSVWDHATHGPDDDPLDWTHANAVDYDAERDVYWLGTRNISTIFEIDRASGDVLRRLGGPDSDVLPPDGADALFTGQHQFDMREGTVRVFDNGPAERMASRAVAYEIDETTGRAVEVWSHSCDPPVYTAVLGDVRQLPSGNLLVTWSVQGQIDEVTPDGELQWRLNVTFGHALGYCSWVPDIQPR